MRKLFLFLLLFAFAAHGQEKELKRVAILRTVDDGSPEIEPTELMHLTVRLREIAGNILQNHYGIMTEQTIIDKLGKENAVKACKEAEGCLAKLGQKISADYIGQARLGRFGGTLTINVELYNSGSGLQASPGITGEAKDVFGLLAVLNEKAPAMFRKMPGVSSNRVIEGGIGGVQIKGDDYEFEGEKRYLANIASDPQGASLSFNGVPDAHCAKTPCSAELAEGSTQIIAVLEQYEIADTTVSIRQNNQSINIRMKPNFGVLEIKPAYSDDIGKNERWSLTINDKAASSWENRLSPNKYKVELSHRCYEDLSFEAGINKDKREVFDMAGYARLKKGGLVLNAERDGKPVSEPVFVNGKQAGETPFSGTVPLCAKIEIGKRMETVDVKLKHNDNVTHTVKNMGGGTDNYIAEMNLDYNANPSIDNGLDKSKTDKEKNILPSVAFSLIGVGLIYAGVHFKNKSDKDYKKYYSLDNASEKEYDKAWAKVKDSGVYGGWCFGLGGVSLAIGFFAFINGGF